MGGLTLKEKTHLMMTQGIIGMCLRRHVGLTLLLLWHSNKAIGILKWCPSGSTVVAVPHHVDLVLLGPQPYAHHADPVLVCPQ